MPVKFSALNYSVPAPATLITRVGANSAKTANAFVLNNVYYLYILFYILGYNFHGNRFLLYSFYELLGMFKNFSNSQIYTKNENEIFQL